MSVSEDLSNLHDDDFEGSTDEISISQEVFYGINSAVVAERRKLSGFINFECQDHKFVKLSPSSNTRAVICESSSKVSCLKNGDNVHSGSPGTCPSTSFAEDFVLAESNNQALPAKRMKLSVDELSSHKPLLQTELASDALLKAVDSGFDHPKTRLDCQIVMCHVVESSGEGVRSSCYLLKQDVETEKKNCFLGTDRKDNSVGSERSDGKEIVVSNTMASPVSQESCEAKTIVTSPAVFSVDKIGSRQHVVRKRKKGTPFELDDDDDTPWTSDSKSELRPFLRKRMFHLLATAGWSIEKRKRQCRTYEEFVYVSPQERPVRELAKAWKVCGQILQAHRFKQMEAEEVRQWASIDQLCSDLYNAVINMDNELKHLEPKDAVVHQWIVLNPFVTVVFVDRKLRELRAGKVVEVKPNASDTSQKPVDSGKGKKSGGRCNGTKPRYSSVASESAVIDFGMQSQVGVEASTSKSVYVSEGSCMRLLEIDGKIESHLGDVQRNGSTDQCSPSLQACGSDLTSLHPASNLYSVPIESAEGTPKNSKKVLKVEMTSFCEDELLNLSIHSRVEGDAQKTNDNTNKADKKNCKRLSSSTKSFKKRFAKKKSLPCKLNDDDLLISVIVQKKKSKSNSKKCTVKGGNKVRRLKKRKNRKGGCRLLPRNMGKGGRNFQDERWTLIAERMVLSWLLYTDTIYLNEIIQYRNMKDETVVKDGMITRDGILCRCCNKAFSLSRFNTHAGLEINRLYSNLFMDSGQPFTLRLLEAWSTEYKARKAGLRALQSDEFDQNDDSCGLCGDGGELLCCDKCPSTFHQSCLSTEELPEGSWYCASCTCWICGNLVDDEDSSAHCGFKCYQCEHKFCLEKLGVDRVFSNPWFCSASCEEVHAGLHSRVALYNIITDGFSWSVLKCIQDDQNVLSAHQLAFKAECNSKLAVALTIMEECFVSMVDSRTGIDMIPQVVYNWGSEFPRLDYHGFYTVVLEKDDVLISVASIRVHGVELAEMPLVATCSKYRRKGMCRRLINAVEQMLISFKVEKLIVAAIPDLVETWTVGFGFVPVEEEEKKSLNKINLMVFPGTVVLKKTLYSGQAGAGPVSSESCLGLNNNIQGGASFGNQCQNKNKIVEHYSSEDAGFMNVKLVSSQSIEIVEAQRINPDLQKSGSIDSDGVESGGCTSIEECGIKVQTNDSQNISPHKETSETAQDMQMQDNVDKCKEHSGDAFGVASGVISNITYSSGSEGNDCEVIIKNADCFAKCSVSEECAEKESKKLEMSSNLVFEAETEMIDPLIPSECINPEKAVYEVVSSIVTNERSTNSPLLEEGALVGETLQVAVTSVGEVVLLEDEVQPVKADELPLTCTNGKVDEVGTIKVQDTKERMLGLLCQSIDMIPCKSASESREELKTQLTAEPESQEAGSPKNSSHPCSSVALEAQNDSASKSNAKLQLV
ncbi:hypothetical protein V2J09_018947 [Rumex salicifolius]